MFELRKKPLKSRIHNRLLFQKSIDSGNKGKIILKIFRKKVTILAKRKANHIIPGMNAASAQGKGTGYNEEYSNEPLTELQKQNNKKRKKNQ